MVFTMIALRIRSLPLAAGTAVAAAVFYIGPPWLMQSYDGSEQSWNVAEYLAGDAYPLIGTAVLLTVALWRAEAADPTAPPSQESAAVPVSVRSVEGAP
jgi:hypothetical protein